MTRFDHVMKQSGIQRAGRPLVQWGLGLVRTSALVASDRGRNGLLTVSLEAAHAAENRDWPCLTLEATYKNQ